MQLPDPLAALIRLQDGLVTVRQLDDAGFSRAARRNASQRHGWRLVLPGVVLTHSGLLSPRQRLVAAQLWAGADAVIAGASAAAWHGVQAAAGEHVVRVLVPASRHLARQSYVVVRRTYRPDPRPWSRPPLRICSPHRAVMDAARAAHSEEEARQIVIEAVQRRIVHVAGLRHELEDGERRGSKFARSALQAAEAGAWSVAEVDVAALLRRSDLLPTPMLNPDLRTDDGTTLPTPDVWYDDVGLAVQVHSKRHHRDLEDWEGTVLSDGVYAEFAVPVVAVTPRFAEKHPERALRRIERAYLACTGLPRPAVTARPRGHGVVA